MDSEFERLVLEKHQLRQTLLELQTLLIALAVNSAADGKVRLTKSQLESTSNYSVEVKALKTGGVNLIVREKDVGS